MNLLRDPLFRVNMPHGVESMTLPALLVALGRDQVVHFPGLQSHQEDAFHVFLCYLAGALLARVGRDDPVQEEAFWLDGLLQLSDSDMSAWNLITEDLSRPAFMQPPLPPTDHGRLKRVADTWDALDLLSTAKNHDVKQARSARPETDAWIYTLISLQTMSGYFGRGRPGISRMNSGFGNRPIVELVHAESPGRRWHDAVLRLLEYRDQVLGGPWGYDPRGLVLVWLAMWDGDTSLPLQKLDPFYIEICRRIRLRNDSSLRADAVPSNGNRIDAKTLNGVVGDAWTPIEMRGSDKTASEKALTISPQGLSPDVLRRLVFADGLRMTPLHKPTKSWKDTVWLSVSVLVRGQGKTEGFHRRRIPIPPAAQRRLFGPPAQRNPLVALSKAGVEYAGIMQNRVLKPAVFAFLEGAPEKLQFDRDSAQAWWARAADRFIERWSEDYFPWLWSVPEKFDEDDVLKQWALRLRNHALAVLREAEQAMPEHVGRRWRTLIQAERVFWGALYSAKNFPFLKEE